MGRIILLLRLYTLNFLNIVCTFQRFTINFCFFKLEKKKNLLNFGRSRTFGTLEEDEPLEHHVERVNHPDPNKNNKECFHRNPNKTASKGFLSFHQQLNVKDSQVSVGFL